MKKRYLKYIKPLLFSGTARDSSIMFVGIIIATLSGFFLTILLVRNLTPNSFGLYITAITFTQLVTDIFELGINTSSLAYLASSKGKIKELFLEAGFVIRLVIAFLVSMIVFFGSSQIAEIIFNSKEMIYYVQVSALGIFALILLGWGQLALQAGRKFVQSMLLGSSVNILRLLGLGLIFIIGINSEKTVFFVSQIVLTLSVVYLFITLKIYKLPFFKAKKDIYKKIILFGLPVGLSFGVSAIYTRLDQLFIFNLIGDKEAGVYGLAYRTAALALFAASAFNNALIPRFASLEKKNFESYFKKVMIVSTGMGIVSMIAIIIAPFLIPIIYGNNFNSSIMPFQLLMVGMFFYIIASPFQSAILFKFKVSHFTVVNAVVSLTITWALLSVLIPPLKSNGAALTIVIVSITQLIIAAAYFWFLYKKNNT